MYPKFNSPGGKLSGINALNRTINNLVLGLILFMWALALVVSALVIPTSGRLENHLRGNNAGAGKDDIAAPLDSL